MSTTMSETVASIEDTIRQALNNSGAAGYYEQYARPVTRLLVAREEAISERLLDYASDAGANLDEARAFIKGCGMAVADPDVEEPDEEAEDDDEDDSEDNRIAAALDRIERRLDGLTDFARRNGYRA